MRTKTKNDTVRVRAIGVLPTNILTHNLESEVPVNEEKGFDESTRGCSEDSCL